MAPYQYLKLKIRGAESLKNDIDPIFLCTTCNKCGMAGLRYKLRQNLVKNGIIPHNLPYLQKAIKKYGNPYSSSRKRQAFLSKNYETSSDTALFLGCTSSLIPRIQKMATSAISLLEDTGTNFRLLPNESCCGYILYTMGDVEGAKEVAQENIHMFEEEGVKRLITACPGCYRAFRRFYPLEGIEVRHILEVIEPKKLPRGLTLTIHYPDHLNQLKKITRRLLKDNQVHRTHYPCCEVPDAKVLKMIKRAEVTLELETDKEIDYNNYTYVDKGFKFKVLLPLLQPLCLFLFCLLQLQSRLLYQCMFLFRLLL